MWRHGRRHGHGMYKCREYTLNGDFLEDYANGFARIEWSDGAKFEGIMQDGRMAKGQFTFPSGNLYVGGFSLTTGDFEGKG